MFYQHQAGKNVRHCEEKIKKQLETLVDNRKRWVIWVPPIHPKIIKLLQLRWVAQKVLEELTRASFLKGHIHSMEELSELLVLSDQVFRTRQEGVYWNLENAIRMKCKRCTAFQDESFIQKAGTNWVDEKCVEFVSLSHWSYFDYYISSFLAEQCD